MPRACCDKRTSLSEITFLNLGTCQYFLLLRSDLAYVKPLDMMNLFTLFHKMTPHYTYNYIVLIKKKIIIIKKREIILIYFSPGIFEKFLKNSRLTLHWLYYIPVNKTAIVPRTTRLRNATSSPTCINRLKLLLRDGKRSVLNVPPCSKTR